MIYYLDSLSYIKIDKTEVKNIDDNDLSTYIPAFADRINPRSLCQKMERRQLYFIINKLRKKMKLTPSDNCEKRSTRSMNLRGNKNAQKRNRKIELGWMHVCKHVRTSNGGGSCKIELPRESKKADILKEAKDFFLMV